MSDLLIKSSSISISSFTEKKKTFFFNQWWWCAEAKSMKWITVKINIFIWRSIINCNKNCILPFQLEGVISLYRCIWDLHFYEMSTTWLKQLRYIDVNLDTWTEANNEFNKWFINKYTVKHTPFNIHMVLHTQKFEE